MGVEQPSGTVRLVFTDIEGSTRLLGELGDAAYRDVLDEHRRVVREAFGSRGTLEAAEVVCRAELDTLASLVDKSLVRRDHERFWMLETIREFAAEQLHAAPEGEAVREAWASYFLALAERAEPELWSVEQGRWLELLDAEHASVRAVLVWALAENRNEVALRLAAAVEPFWEARGHIDEGRQLLTEALARAGRDAPAARAKALFGLSRLLALRREVALEQRVLEEAAGLARDAGGDARARVLAQPPGRPPP
jgi:predicted ATPase